MGQQSSRIINPPIPRAAARPQDTGLVNSGAQPLEQLPKLRELREDVFFKAEYLYLHNLVSLTGRNIRKACELSGLSRSRLYTLLKKYQIHQPLNDH
jgi:transcriptional regulator of acetoin/glycerol metabolism